MTGQIGRNAVIRIGDGGSPATYTAVGGFRTKRLAINSTEVDGTNQGSQAWRELVENAGINSLNVSGDGVFTDSAAEGTVLNRILNRNQEDFQIVFPGLGTFEGMFQVTSYEVSAAHDGTVTFSFEMASAQVITFTSA